MIMVFSVWILQYWSHTHTHARTRQRR